MLRFSANLGFLWTNLPLLEAIKAASNAGFSAIELHFPYAVPAPQIRSACRENNLSLLSLNTNISGPPNPHFGLGAVPGREREFRALASEAMNYASEAGAVFVHIMAGAVNEDQRIPARQTFIENLEWAAKKADKLDLEILLEPLNNADVPRYFYNRVTRAIDIMDAVGSPRIKLMFDAYHVGRMGEDIIDTLHQNYHHIGHIQIASIPDRSEPDHGDFDYSRLFSALEELEYKGWIGCEYVPRGRVEDGLIWRNSLV